MSKEESRKSRKKGTGVERREGKWRGGGVQGVVRTVSLNSFPVVCRLW